MAKKFSVEYNFQPITLEFNTPTEGIKKEWRMYAAKKAIEAEKAGINEDKRSPEALNSALKMFGEIDEFKKLVLLRLHIGGILKEVEDFDNISSTSFQEISDWFDTAVGVKISQKEKDFTKP